MGAITDLMDVWLGISTEPYTVGNPDRWEQYRHREPAPNKLAPKFYDLISREREQEKETEQTRVSMLDLARIDWKKAGYHPPRAETPDQLTCRKKTA